MHSTSANMAGASWVNNTTLALNTSVSARRTDISSTASREGLGAKRHAFSSAIFMTAFRTRASLALGAAILL